MTAGNPRSPFPEQAGLHPEDPVLPIMVGHTEGDPTGPTGIWLELNSPPHSLWQGALPSVPHL